MAIEINGKVYRNIQEQVAENQDNIAELETKVDNLENAVLPLTEDNPIQIFDENTFADVTAYLDGGHILLYTMYNERLYVYSNSTTTYHEFICMYSDNPRIYYRRLSNGDVWSGSYKNIQTQSNMTQTITNSSTTYPSNAAARLLMTPTYMDDALISNIGEAQFTFGSNVFNASNNKWLGTFTMGNCFFMIPLYGLTQGTTYKTNGTFVYSSLGEVVSTTVNYKITNDTTITVWSGNSNFTMQEGYTAYLSLLRLF